MPTIINTYKNSTGNNVGDLLGDMTEALWGPKAGAAAYAREKLMETQRENSALEYMAAQAQKTGQPVDLTDPTALANSYRLGSRISKFQEAQRGALAARDPTLVPTTQGIIGAGGAYSSTPQAVRAAQEAQVNLERQREAGRLNLERERDAMALVDVVSPEGQVIKVPRNQVSTYMEKGYTGSPLSKDQIVGGVLQRALAGQPGAPATPPAPPAMTAQPAGVPWPGLDAPVVRASAGPPAAPAPAPAAPAASPFEGLSPDVRHLAGLPTGNVSLWDPNTRQVYQSQDGGQTVMVLGHRIPVMGSGLQPVSNEQAVTQTQDNLTRGSLAPLPPPPGQPSRAALAAERTSGVGSALQNEVNTLAGVFGLGEFGPHTNEARNYLTNLVGQTRNVLAAAPGRVSVQAQKWAAEPFPEPGWFGMTGINAEQQKNDVMRTVQHLRETYEMVRTEALNPNLPPTERQKYATYLHGLGQVIQMWEAPPPASPAGNAPAAPAVRPPAAPTAGSAQAAPAPTTQQTSTGVRWSIE